MKLKCLLSFVMLSCIFNFTGCSFSSSENQNNSNPENTNTNTVALSLNDTPVGFGYKNVTQQKTNAVTVSTKEELVAALKQGGLIYINGIIDLSEGMLPSTGGGTNSCLDAFVKANSDFEDYDSFVESYTQNCSTTTNDKKSSSPESKYGKQMWKLNNAYKAVVQPEIVSNTTIIGLTSQSGIKGGPLILSDVSNVVIRNVTLMDAYDPFPHHEKNDGYNAQFDTICIQDGSHDIWIDHVTLKDTMTLKHVMTGGTEDEKWQNYDGLLDMKSEDTTDITVSYCRFENHDKTMLIGSSDTEWDGCYRYVTLHHNYFINCGQRLPMVRQTNIHIFNNYYYYDKDTAPYTQQYAVGVRNKSKVFSQNNYFTSGIKYSYRGNSSLKGTLLSEGDVDNSSESIKTSEINISEESSLFTIPYSYTLESASELATLIPQNAGSGTLSLTE